MRNVKPFFVPPATTITAARWQRLVDDAWEDLDDYIEDWDQTTNLFVRCIQVADLTTIRRATGLTDNSPLAWSAGWRATDTGLVETPVTVRAESDGEVRLQFETGGASRSDHRADSQPGAQARPHHS